MCILALDLSTTNEVCGAPLLRFGIGTEAPCRRLAWIYSVNMSSVSGSRSGASCGACWPPSITPLIPAFAIRFLRSWSSAITWFRALPFQPELRVEPVGAANADLRAFQYHAQGNRALDAALDVLPVHSQLFR